MDTKPENYARNVIAIVAPMDSPKKGNPSNDFKRIFIGLDLDDNLLYLIECTCRLLEQIDITKGSAERVLEDINAKCQNLKERLIVSTFLMPEDDPFRRSNLYCMALSMVLQKYANALTINLDGANTAINAVDIDAAMAHFCDKKNPIRSLTLLFHAYESGLLLDVDFKQFLASRLSDVIRSGKTLMETLVKVGTDSVNRPKIATTEDIGIDFSELCNIGKVILHDPTGMSPDLSWLGPCLNCNRNDEELGDYSIGAYSMTCRFWVMLKETVFLLLRGIMYRYDNLEERVSRLRYLRKHLETYFGMSQNGAIGAFRLMLYELTALYEQENFGCVNASVLMGIESIVSIHSDDNVNYLGKNFPETTYANFLSSLITDEDCELNYGSGAIADVIERLRDKEANPLAINAPWLAKFLSQAMSWVKANHDS